MLKKKEKRKEIKAIYNKPTANIILDGEKLKVFSSKIRDKTRMLTLAIFIQYNIPSPSLSNQTRKIQKSKLESKTVMFVDDMILYIENPKDTTKKNTRAQ